MPWNTPGSENLVNKYIFPVSTVFVELNGLIAFRMEFVLDVKFELVVDEFDSKKNWTEQFWHD